MLSAKRFQAALLLVTLICSPLVCRAEITLALTKAFVKKYKDKATIETSFRVDKHHDEPNDVGIKSDDGDIHIAGRDNVVRLPMVAEIINGRFEDDALQFMLQMTAGQAVPVTGVWRLWFEHPGHEDQKQGQTVPVPKNTNPDHIFELHPLAEFAGFDCRDSFLPIRDNDASPPKEFRGYPATTAFPAYETRPGTITQSKTAIMITSNKAGYNYAEFVMKLAGKPKDVGDGYIVFATVYGVGSSGSADDPVVEENRRMVFVKDSPPGDKVATMKKGDKLHVLGIPRVNLNAVYAIATNLESGEEYSETLPYEMIIVAVLPK